MPTTLPPLHSQLVLRDGEGRTWHSRVEAIDAYALTVARPFDLPLEDSPSTGATLEVTWTSDGGAYSLPCGLVETVREGLVALWIVSPQGETTRAQRRAHFRLPIDGEVAVTVADAPAAAGDVLTGHLVDVSEAGLRFRTSPAEAAPFIGRAPVAAVFEIRQERFEVEGTVLRTFPSERANGDPATDVVVTLELSEPEARDLRRALLAEQVQRRRLARD
jgi:c-di-GMP-binding flagellar brake protein YcgR